MKILIVDDNTGTLNALRIGLTSLGYETLTASSGNQALELLVGLQKHEQKPSLLLTDMRMPKMNGLELIHSARKIQPELSAILMTAYGNDDIRRATGQLNRCGYLAKPFTSEELEKRIRMMNKRILVIDDDLAIRKSFLLSLEDTDFHVDTAESGEKGIEMEKQYAYDLVYLDLKMPGLNGVQTLQHIRKNNENVPVYIITAFLNEYFKELDVAKNDGLDFEILRKPLSGEQLVALTEAILYGPGSVA